MNRLYLFIFFLLFFIDSNSGTTYNCNPSDSCGCSIYSTDVTERIVGGEAAPNHAWGWALSLQKSHSQRCTAVLISSQYALTAAHCVSGLAASELTILAGTNYLSDTSADAQRRTVLSFAIHPSYDSSTDVYDIAVLYFAPLSVTSSSTVKFICLPAPNVDSFVTGSNVVAVGWGVTVETSSTPSNSLLQVTVQIVSNTATDCKEGPIHNANVQLCAGVSGGGKDTCQGDSGGPLMFFVNNQWVLAGLTSYGDGCAKAGHSGVYTRVSALVTYVESVINSGVLTGQTTIRPPNSARNPKSLLYESTFVLIFCLLILIKI